MTNSEMEVIKQVIRELIDLLVTNEINIPVRMQNQFNRMAVSFDKTKMVNDKKNEYHRDYNARQRAKKENNDKAGTKAINKD